MQIPDDIQRAFDAYLASLAFDNDTEEFVNTYEAELAKLAEWLKPFPEAERLAFIEAGLLKQNPAVAISVAELCLENTESFRSLIKKGFPYVDSTQISGWIRHSLPLIGEAKLLTYINELSSSPLIKNLAMYSYKRHTRPRPAKKQG